MLINYSENEKEFFKQLLLEYNLRVDGRDNMSIREYEIKRDIIPSSLSSIKIIYNNGLKEILFAIKGEIVDKSNSIDKLLNVSIDSMHKIEDIKLKKEIENYIESFIFSEIPIEYLKINKESDNFYWKLYIDIYIFDIVKLSLLMMLSIGIKELLKNLKVPKLVLFKNELTGNIEYDLIENYEDISEIEKSHFLLDELSIPDIFVFGVISENNNNIFLDPSDEESSISNSIIIVASNDNRITNVQSIGSNVEIQQMFDISSIIKSINFNI
jgi:exosome complex RNA-binding protein Rrp42 (RNase PH superfamily)